MRIPLYGSSDCNAPQTLRQCRNRAYPTTRLFNPSGREVVGCERSVTRQELGALLDAGNVRNAGNVPTPPTPR